MYLVVFFSTTETFIAKTVGNFPNKQQIKGLPLRRPIADSVRPEASSPQDAPTLDQAGGLRLPLMHLLPLHCLGNLPPLRRLPRLPILLTRSLSLALTTRKKTGSASALAWPGRPPAAPPTGASTLPCCESGVDGVPRLTPHPKDPPLHNVEAGERTLHRALRLELAQGRPVHGAELYVNLEHVLHILGVDQVSPALHGLLGLGCRTGVPRVLLRIGIVRESPRKERLTCFDVATVVLGQPGRNIVLGQYKRESRRCPPHTDHIS